MQFAGGLNVITYNTCRLFNLFIGNINIFNFLCLNVKLHKFEVVGL